MVEVDESKYQQAMHVVENTESKLFVSQFFLNVNLFIFIIVKRSGKRPY